MQTIEIDSNLERSFLEQRHGWHVSSVARDIEDMAAYFEDKAKKLRGLAVAVRVDGATWAPPGWQSAARTYTNTLSHNSSGTTASVSSQIAECAAEAGILTALYPERHQEGE